MSTAWKPAPSRRRMTLSERERLYQQLSQALASGGGLVEALDAIARDPANRRWAGAAAELLEDIRSGWPLFACMRNHSTSFPEAHVRAVAAAEAQGNLGDIFRSLVENTRVERRIASIMFAQTAFLVGAALTAAALAVFWSLAVASIQVCGTGTAFAIGIPKAFDEYYPVLVGVFLGVCVIATASLIAPLTARGAYFLECVWLSLPLAGALRLRAAAAQFSHSLGVLLRFGAPRRESLDAVIGDVKSAVIRRHLETGIGRAPGDAPLSETLGHTLHLTRLLSPVWLWTLAQSELRRTEEKALAALAEAGIQELLRKTRADRIAVLATMLPLLIFSYCVLTGSAQGFGLGGGGA